MKQIDLTKRLLDIRAMLQELWKVAKQGDEQMSQLIKDVDGMKLTSPEMLKEEFQDG